MAKSLTWALIAPLLRRFFGTRRLFVEARQVNFPRSSTAYSMGIPVATELSLVRVAITERSRKFYDGTYQYRANGFIDDVGVYRDFDCLDPAARAPTPLPPMFPDDSEDEDLQEKTGARLPIEKSVTVASSMPSTSPTSRTLEVKPAIAALKKGVVRPGKSTEAVYGKSHSEEPSGIKTGGEKQKNMTARITPNKTTDPQEPASSPLSDLSDCTPEMLNWEMDERLMKTGTVKDKPKAPAVSERAPKQSTTTRGVAQKVRRPSKKRSKVPTTLSMEQDSGTSRRRCARLR
ncbi:hypothetical protein EK21DRAFT_117521 [Setomelanomma holmii]|uniref:Uncharacterized protein n=1 Tax=Setomelanomma holmii TaxID=210430 RepID=A0A9P4LI15_9PLEO|nr:hypothetical protein EK21DRAFT_117521 [Setomelanomma holmii]